jgi:hypothetical protein
MSRRLFAKYKTGFSGKPVSGERIECAVDADMISRHTTNDWKEERRPSGPECRIAIPEQISPLCILKLNEFGTMQSDTCAQLSTREQNRRFGHGLLMISYQSRSFST